MKTDQDAVVLNSLKDFNLATAESLWAGACGIVIGPEGRRIVDAGHLAFQRFLVEKGRYVYGSTTAPGSRAKTLLTPEAVKSQGATFGQFITMRPGVAGRSLSRRMIKLALLARLTNALSGHGKISLPTAERIAALAENPPEVPLQGLASSGEVMALSWLLAPLAEASLEPGEAMALVNGSPFSTAMVSEVAIMTRRNLQLADLVFALSIEAARAPLEHYRVELADHWPDPFYKSSLERLNELLTGAHAARLVHQAPVSWRIIPNILASARRAQAQASEIATISLAAVKDNPTFLGGPDGGEAVSSGGYHDHQAGRSIEAVTVAYADLCVLIAKQVTRLVDGSCLGLPPLLVRGAGDGVGTEYFVWTLTEPVVRVNHAATPVGLDASLEDPVGNQSDVAQPIFMSYARHLDARDALHQCLAVLYTVALLALDLEGRPPPPALSPLVEKLGKSKQDVATASAAGLPLREVLDALIAWTEAD